MPFAQWHAPHESEDVFRERFPADYICEALDQTRGWFYSLLAVNTLLFGRAPYEHVVCLGLILDADGQKMSKSRGNIVVPWDVIDRYGADAFRWYFFTSKQPWDGYRFNIDAIGDSVRLFLRAALEHLQLLVLYRTLYARRARRRADRPRPLDPLAAERDGRRGHRAPRGVRRDDRRPRDRGVRRRTSPTGTCAARGGASGRATAPRSTRCSTAWSRSRSCSRRSRRSSPTRSTTTSTAPSRASTSPTGPSPARATRARGRDGRRARDGPPRARRARPAKVKLRQPLHEAVVVAAGREREAIERLAEVVREELNVKTLRFVEQADELGSYEVKPNYRTLGPRFGKAMPQVAAAVEALDPAHVADGAARGADGRRRDRRPRPPARPPTTWCSRCARSTATSSSARARTRSRSSSRSTTRCAARASPARSCTRSRTRARRPASQIEDRIALTLAGDAELLDAARVHEPYVDGRDARDARRVRDGNGAGEPATIEGRELRILVARADGASA